MTTHIKGKPHDVVHNLAMAVIDSSVMPILLLDKTFNIITASASSTSLFGQTPEAMKGRNLFELGDGKWNIRVYAWLSSPNRLLIVILL